MQRQLLFAAIFASMMLSSHAGQANMAIAVGYTGDIKKDGYVWGGGFGDTARETAMNVCKGTTKPTNPKANVMPTGVTKAQSLCKIVADFSDKCFAIAQDSDPTSTGTGMGWAVEDNLKTSEAVALAKCKSMADDAKAKNCKIRYSYCDGSAQ